MKLTKREIDALACPTGRRDMIVFDDALPGFGLRVTEAGTKTFLLQYQIGGRSGRRTRMVLGPYGEVTPPKARRLAEIARAKLRLGLDPANERQATLAAKLAAADAQQRAAAAAAFTFSELIKRWASEGLADRSPVHQTEAPRALRSTFATLLDQPANMVEPADVQLLLDVAVKQRPIAARRAGTMAEQHSIGPLAAIS